MSINALLEQIIADTTELRDLNEKRGHSTRVDIMIGTYAAMFKNMVTYIDVLEQRIADLETVTRQDAIPADIETELRRIVNCLRLEVASDIADDVHERVMSLLRTTQQRARHE